MSAAELPNAFKKAHLDHQKRTGGIKKTKGGCHGGHRPISLTIYCNELYSKIYKCNIEIADFKNQIGDLQVNMFVGLYGTHSN
jgi:hypothetical protein